MVPKSLLSVLELLRLAYVMLPTDDASPGVQAHDRRLRLHRGKAGEDGIAAAGMQHGRTLEGGVAAIRRSCFDQPALQLAPRRLEVQTNEIAGSLLATARSNALRPQPAVDAIFACRQGVIEIVEVFFTPRRELEPELEIQIRFSSIRQHIILQHASPRRKLESANVAGVRV